MTKKRILVFFDAEETNNINYFLNNIDNKEYDVDLIIEDIINIKKEISKKVNIKKYHNSKIQKNIFKIKFLLNNKNKYDKSYLFTSDNIFANSIVRKCSKHKTIFIKLNKTNEYNFREYFIKRKIYEFDKLIFKTYEDQTTFIKHYPTLSKKTCVINDFINHEEIENLSKKEIKEKIKKTDKTILLISELNEEKNNILNTLNLIKEIKQDIKNIKLYIIGDGIDKYAYESFIEDNDLENNIFLLGEKENIYPHIEKCKFILLNSKEKLDKYLIPSLILNNKVISKCRYSDDIIKIDENYEYFISNNIIKEELKKILKNKKRKIYNFDYDKLNKEKLKKLNSKDSVFSCK